MADGDRAIAHVLRSHPRDQVPKLAEFVKNDHLTFPILSDPDKTVAKAYGVVHEGRPVPERWTFYIDKDGKITAIDKTVKPATSAEDMIARLGELKVEPRR